MVKYFNNSIVTFFLLVLTMIPSSVFAHGESVRGIGGGSVNTIGAEIPTRISIGIRYDERRYSRFTDAEMVQFRIQGEDVHQHSKEQTLFLSAGLPISENFDLNLLLQGSKFSNFKDNGDEFATECFAASPEDSACISKTKTSMGLGDFLVMGRYQFYSKKENELAALFGIMIPTGSVRNRVDSAQQNGKKALLGTHNQPGSGAISFQMGGAYSGHLTEKIGVEADVLFRINTEGAKQFQLGNSIQTDIALSYGHHDSFIIPVLELNSIFQEKDLENNEVKRNSGGNVLYISPGFSIKVTEKQSIYGSFSYPIWQQLGGISNDESWRFGAGYNFVF